MSAEFLRPTTLEQALQALSDPTQESRILAGGTALTIMLRHRLIEPRRLISLGGLPELSAIRPADHGLRIGSMTVLRAIEQSELVRRSHPILASACGEVGNVRVRNQATLGGNLAEADYASDPPTALLALEATVRIASPAGERRLPVADFLRGFFTTALEPDEILTEIEVPPLPATARGTYLKYRSRSSEDRPCIAVAVVAVLDAGRCRELRVAVGAAADTPRRVPEAEALALGERLTDRRIADVAEACSQAIETLDDLRGSAWYRKEMIRVFVARALREVRADGR